MGTRRPTSATRLVVLLLAACLVPVLVHGLVGPEGDEDDYELSGAAAEGATAGTGRDDDHTAASGDDAEDEAEDAEDDAEDEADDERRGPSVSSSPSSSTTTTVEPTTTTAEPTTTTTTSPPPPDTEPPPQPEPTSGPSPRLSPTDRVLALVNQVRAEVPCAPLAVDDRLVAAAQLHSEDMAARNYMAHVTPEGKTPGDRAAAQGYTGPVGENVAQGYPSPEAVMDGWMESRGHRENIENCGYTTIGIGVSADGWYWTQLFGM